MKVLIVVRHAKSSWVEPDLPDFKRPLNERGERDGPQMAKQLKERDIAVNTVISSPAVRALTTCHIFADILGFPKTQVEEIKELYHAGDEIILSVIKKLPDNKDDVAMLFGHNPGLTDFVNNLLEEDIDNIPTTGIVCCKLKIDKWVDAKWGCGEMEFFDWPKKK